MTHIWQELRSGLWLTAARASGYSLILLGLCAVAVAGWVALPDGLIDRNGKPIGTDHDLVVLAVSIVFFVRHGLSRGFRDYEISLLAAAWIVPLITRGITNATGIPLGLMALLTLCAITLRRAATDRAGFASLAYEVAQA